MAFLNHLSIAKRLGLGFGLLVLLLATLGGASLWQGGRVTAVGTHDELLARSDLYREVFEHQRLQGLAR